MSKTPIEWTDVTWNPTRGCSRVSEGCRNCYAERVAARFSGTFKGTFEPGPFHGFAVQTGGGHWTGKVELIESKLQEPLRWRKPRRVFVNSMSDLFHEALPDEAIDRVFAVMALCPQHTFQVLTKRAERMLAYCKWSDICRRGGPRDMPDRIGAYISESNRSAVLDLRWPLPNVQLGVSVEDQPTADARIALLLQTPAALRFVSYEPALEAVDFTRFLHDQHPIRRIEDIPPIEDVRIIDWLICGGESGPGARPFDLAWARSARDQCAKAGVPFFMKQIGRHPFDSHHPRQPYFIHDRKGGVMDEWPEDLRVRQLPA